ncbi:hypothetical protein JCM5296_003625 [Sporobolomyces johnsonii]
MSLDDHKDEHDQEAPSPSTAQSPSTVAAAATTPHTNSPSAPSMSSSPHAMSKPATSVSATALSNLFRDKLEAIGHLSVANWTEWSAAAARLTGAILGDHFALKKLDGTVKRPEMSEAEQTDDLGTWTLLGVVFKEVVDQYGGEEAASKIRHIEVEDGDTPKLYKALYTAYSRTTSGSERTAFLVELTLLPYDSTTTSPAQLSSSLIAIQRNLNAACKYDALQASAADQKSDPHTVAALNAAFSNYLLRSLFISKMPEDIARSLEDYAPRNEGYTSLVDRAERMWQDAKQQRAIAEGGSAFRVMGPTRREDRRAEPPPPASTPPTRAEPSPTSSPVSSTPSSKPAAHTVAQFGKRPKQRLAATKYPNYQRWRGGTRTNRNGVEVFAVPRDSCFRCFQAGHFAKDCKYSLEQQASQRVRILGEDGIKVQLSDALALFVDQEEASSAEAPAARFIGQPGTQDMVDTTFHVDEELLKAYFVSSTAAADAAVAFPTIADDPPPLDSLALPQDLPADYILDTGANHHYTTRVDHLRRYKPFPRPMRIGGAFSSGGWAYGSGSVVFAFPGRTVMITNVYYIPLLGVNLLSQTTLMLAGIRFSNTRSTLKVADEDGTTLIEIPVARTLKLKASMVVPSPSSLPQPPSSPSTPSKYPAAVRSNEVALFATTGRANPLVWHGRTGHTSTDRLKLLHGGLAKGMDVDGSLATLDGSNCSVCARGKLTRRPVLREAENRATRPLERLAGNVWGPCAIAKRKGSRYLYAIVDDSSRFMWGQTIKAKSEVPGITAARIKREERERQVQVVSFRSDQGGEFKNAALDGFFEREGITHEKTVPYKHAQNGLIERQWRSVFDMARCWLAESGLPLSFWDLAVLSAIHVKNRLPTSANPGSISPFEAYYGRQPDVSHLRSWGCVVYVRVESPQTKVHPRGLRGRFVGYLDATKGWLIWVPELRRLMEAWDVLWMEDTFGNERTEGENARLDLYLGQLQWCAKEDGQSEEEEGEQPFAREGPHARPPIAPPRPPRSPLRQHSPPPDSPPSSPSPSPSPSPHQSPSPPPSRPTRTRNAPAALRDMVDPSTLRPLGEHTPPTPVRDSSREAAPSPEPPAKQEEDLIPGIALRTFAPSPTPRPQSTPTSFAAISTPKHSHTLAYATLDLELDAAPQRKLSR